MGKAKVIPDPPSTSTLLVVDVRRTSRLSHIMDVKCFPRSGITTPTLFDYMV